MRKNIRVIYKLSFVVGCLLFAVCGVILWDASPRWTSGREAVGILIAPGMSAADAADVMKEEGLIANRAALLWQMRCLGVDRQIKPGRYTLHPGSSRSVALELQKARPEVPNVTILPGAFLEDVVSALSPAAGDLPLGEALSDDMNFPAQLRPFLPDGADDRLMFLAPQTYAILGGRDAAARLVRSASEEWWKLHGGEVLAADRQGDLRGEGIVASIIQKEALIDAEKPLMAGVFINRLRSGMMLQSCATVVYAWRVAGIKKTRLGYDDLTIDSPYNTYRHEGLPPGHIGIPAKSSWSAALFPETTDKMFFVAGEDGKHIFSRTYAEHLAASRAVNGRKR